MEKRNEYPIILIHGLVGWGKDDGIHSFFPYFGPLIKHLDALGVEYYAPSLGPFNSAWDRVCVLWAYLFGGTVDYGKVHSEKYGHARYGKTYEHGVLEDLGKTENHKKLIAFGHSFGGPVIRLMGTLFTYGSEEERAGTDPDDLSPLFAGGHGDLLHALTTLSGVNNGTALASMFGIRGMSLPTLAIHGLCGLLGNTPITKIFNGHLQQYGIMPEPEDVTGWHLPDWKALLKGLRVMDAAKGEDNVWREMEIEVIQEELLPKEKVDPKAYYFAQRADATEIRHGRRTMTPTLKYAICYFPGLLTGTWSGPKVRPYGVGTDEAWQHCDGFVNIPGQTAPFNQPQKEADWDTDFKPGIWYNMPIETGDHTLWNGFLVGGKVQCPLYDRMIALCRSLPDAE